MLLSHLVLVLGTAVITFCLYPLWIKFLYAHKMGEKIRETGPQTHLKKQGTPTMGGLVFVLTAVAVTFIFNRSREQSILPIFVALLSGAFGLLDDLSKLYRQNVLFNLFPFLRNSSHKSLISRFMGVFGSKTGKEDLDSFQKFFIQLCIGVFVAYWCYVKLGWHQLWLPLMGNVDVGLFYPIFIIGLFLLFLNCVAFTDGLDGLLGGLSIIVFLAWWAISYLFGYYSLAGFCATFTGSLLAFMYFNIYPARIFMGNVGSHVLGAVMVMISIVLHRELAFFVIGCVFLVDGLSSPLQSLSKELTKKKIFLMAPIHHHFELLGWPESKVVFRFWIFGIIFAFGGILISFL